MKWLYVTALLAISPAYAEDEQPYVTLAEESVETYPYWELTVMHPEGWTSRVLWRAEDKAAAYLGVTKHYCLEQLGLDSCVVKGPSLAKNTKRQYVKK